MEEHGKYDVTEFAGELARASGNRQVGTTSRFENDHVRVWEILLEPGERVPFHRHDQTYFWTVVEPGRGLQRFLDGSSVARDYTLGETKYLVHSPDDFMIHDLENIGETRLRFVTVELKH